MPAILVHSPDSDETLWTERTTGECPRRSLPPVLVLADVSHRAQGGLMGNACVETFEGEENQKG